MKYFGGCDVGSTYTKCVILDENGNLIAASKEFDGDSTNYTLEFPDFDIATLNGKIIRIKFTVDGKLFAFGFADENGDYGGAHGAGIADIQENYNAKVI